MLWNAGNNKDAGTFCRRVEVHNDGSHPMIANTTIKTLSLIAAFFCTLALTNTASANTQFTATVDRNTLSIEETLTLKLRFYEQVMFGEPDISQLEKNFNILGSHRNQQYRSVNGQAESWTQWQITLAPKREGQLLIPSFSFKGSFTEAMEVQVNKATVYSGKVANQPVFMEVSIDKSSAFVQEQVIYSVRLFTSVNLHSMNKNEPSVDNALVKKISENQYQKNINGQSYVVVELRYALFPQKSGLMTIPSSLWSVVTNEPRRHRDPFMSDPFFGRGGKKINLRTPEKAVNVLPQPKNYDGDVWLPAASLEIQQSWSQSPDSFKVGEPITRTIRIKAKGVLASQLPPLQIDPIDGVNYYPDKPQSDEQLGSNGITTVKQESYAIVASKPGKITLPAVTLRWWDTGVKRMQEARLPIQEITIAAAENNASLSAIEPSPIQKSGNLEIERQQASGGTSLWFYTTLLLGASTLLFLVLWLRDRTETVQNIPASKPAPERNTDSKVLFDALDRADPVEARQALIKWGQQFFQQAGLSRLETLGTLSQNADFAADLQALDSLLYGTEEQRLPPALIDALKEKITALEKSPNTVAADSSTLPPLYR